MKKLSLGILAHVDAGKTTLTESLLYDTGMIRSAGRVDNGDAFLDTEALEKKMYDAKVAALSDILREREN